MLTMIAEIVGVLDKPTHAPLTKVYFAGMY